MFLTKYIKSLVSLIYPDVCKGCGGYLVQGETEICTKCLCELSKTGYHKQEANPAEHLFYGKIKINKATAYCHFHKGGVSQSLLHNLKYKNAKKLGIILGELMGNETKNSPIADVDYIVPVPLHPSKLKKRGYNQAELLAQGISNIWSVPLDTKTLARVRQNTTQTHKNINERYLNSIGLFDITDSETLKGKRVLLVDDVITTGATLEACAKQLSKIEGITINCMAFAIA